jgi:hypothetical protein
VVVICVQKIIKTLNPLYANRARNRLDGSYAESDTSRPTLKLLLNDYNSCYDALAWISLLNYPLDPDGQSWD